MLTFVDPGDFGEVDLDKYKPDIRDLADGEVYSRDEARALHNQARKLAVRLKRHGVKGEKYGATKILDFFKARFPKADGGYWKIPSRSGIDQWIQSISFAKDEPAYSPEAVPRQWRSYVARLSLISEFWHERPLTGYEAEMAQYVGNEFQDLFGEKVDLIPQLAVVRQVASIDRLKSTNKNSVEAEAFEAYFEYAPWKLGADFFSHNLAAEELGFPIIRDFVLSAGESQNLKEVSPVFKDALRQLGMPYSYCYAHDDGGLSVEGDPAVEDESKGACNWVFAAD